MTVVGIVVQGVVAVLAALLGAGWLRTRRDKQRQHVETDVTAAGAWQQIAAEHKAERNELKAEIADLRAELGVVRGEAAALREEVGELREEVEDSRELKRKYLAALAYIAYLLDALARHVDPASIKPVPAEIGADL